MLAIKRYFNDFASLIYPELCLACDRQLYSHEKNICIFCRTSLPETNYHIEKGNPLEKHFWGRVEVEHAAALFFFGKGSKTQHLLHQFKYKNKREVGEELGKYYGGILKKVSEYDGIDVVVPVPLHKKKEFHRGYNQSAVLAAGIAAGMAKPMLKDALERVEFTETQTRKTRIERWQNVEAVFKLKQPNQLEGKHILIVDDVITTGATIEACIRPLLELKGTKVTVAALATAQHF